MYFNNENSKLHHYQLILYLKNLNYQDQNLIDQHFSKHKKYMEILLVIII